MPALVLRSAKYVLIHSRKKDDSGELHVCQTVFQQSSVPISLGRHLATPVTDTDYSLHEGKHQGKKYLPKQASFEVGKRKKNVQKSKSQQSKNVKRLQHPPILLPA